MIGILGALFAALAWGSTPVADARASRAIGALSTWAWTMLLGLVISVPLAFGTAGVPHPDARTVVWTTATGVSIVLGMGLFYRALQLGSVPLVAGILAGDGTCAAIYALVAGERLAGATLAGIAVVVAGMAIVVAPRRGITVPGAARAAALAIAATVSFGFSLFGGAHVVHDLSPFWITPATRAIGVLAVAIPLMLRGALVRPTGVIGFLAYSTIAQIAGFIAYLYATRAIGVPVAAVLASQAALVGIAFAFVLLRERLARRQLIGMAIVLVGVATVSLTRS